MTQPKQHRERDQYVAEAEHFQNKCIDLDLANGILTKERDAALARIEELENVLGVFSWKINQCLRIECESCLAAIKELGQALERKGESGE